MTKKITRRDMLHYSAVAGLGTFYTPSARASVSDKQIKQEIIKMPERVLGRTGMKLPILSMGVNRADNLNVLRAAYNSGIYHFDTGYVYQKGKSEEMIGNVLGNKPRESFNIATKAMYDYPLQDNFEDTLFEHLHTSLKRMHIDYVDIFYAHSIDSVEKLTDPRVLAALQKVKDSGKARFIGFSSHNQKNEILHAAIDAGIFDVAMVTYNFKVKELKETDEAIDRAVKAGMGVIAMKVMAGGTEDSEGKKKIDGKACLKWVWKNKNITTVLPSVANYDELDSCFEAVQEVELTPAEELYLSGLAQADSLFCRQCEVCRSQCPKNMPVPDLMRAYMYAYGYKYAKLSKETLESLPLTPDVCQNCDVCAVTCPSGFAVKDKITALSPLLNAPDEFLS